MKIKRSLYDVIFFRIQPQLYPYHNSYFKSLQKYYIYINLINMKKQILIFFCLLMFSNTCINAQNIVFPPQAVGLGWVDVTKPPYNAPNNGIGDATAALNAALVANIGTGKRIYLPNGTYLISNTIVWPNQANGFLPAGGFLQGQSKTGVIIKLKKNCPGFTDSTLPKAMIVTGRDPAQNFGNCIKKIS